MENYELSNLIRFGNELKLMNKRGLETKIKDLIKKLSDKKKAQLINRVTNCPGSVRTFQRSLILLSLYYMQPTTKNGIIACGFPKNTVSKVLRELQKENIILEKSKIFMITENGNKVIYNLLENIELNNWFDQFKSLSDAPEKPNIHYIKP